MPNSRPTAKEAIEALKVHQLRRENVVIFEEVKSLRTEVACRQEELSKLQKQINSIRDDFKQICRTQSETNSSTQGLENAIKSILEAQEELRQVQAAFKQDYIEGLVTNREACQKNEASLSSVSEQPKQLQKKIAQPEQANIEAVEQVQDELDSKADKTVIAQLEEKLENFMQQIEVRMAAQETAISKIPESTDILTGRSPAFEAPQSVAGSDASLWKPIGQNSTFVINDHQQDDMVLGESLPQVRAQPQPAKGTNTAPSAKQPNAISNIAHRVQAPRRTATCALPPSESQKAITPPTIDTINVPTDTRTGWQFLQALLRMKQQQEESILQYFVRLKALIDEKLHSKEIIATSLKRFAFGIVDDNYRVYFQHWLDTSRWTLNNARDCAILLAHCRGHGVAARDVAAPAQLEPPIDFTRRSSRIKRFGIREQAESGDQVFSSSDVLDLDENPLPRPMEKTVNIQQRAKESGLKDNFAGSIEGALSPAKKRKAAWTRPRNRKGCFMSQKELSTKRQTPTPEPSESEFAPSPLSTPAPKTPVRGSKKRKDVFDLPSEDEDPGSPDHPVLSSPPNRALRKRVLTLVPLAKKTRVVIPETSDPVGLPAAPGLKTPLEQEEQMVVEEARDAPGKKRKRRHGTPPEIPILNQHE